MNKEQFLHQDLFAVVMLFGIIQSVLLIYLFTFKNKAPFFLKLLGLLVLSLTLITVEIFLSYSGYIVYAIHLVDFSEPLNFVLGPLIYFFVFCACYPKPFNKKYYLHFIPFVLYLAYCVPFYLQPESVKLDAFLSAYQPVLANPELEETSNLDPLFLKRFVNELCLMHISIYLALSLWLLKLETKSLNQYTKKLVRAVVWGMSALLILTLLVKFSFRADLGDYIIAVSFAVSAFALNGILLQSSQLLSEKGMETEHKVPEAKYSKSGLSEAQKDEILHQLNGLIGKEKFYVDPNISLQGLAARIHTHPNYLSQVINERLGKSFFDFIAQLRVDEAIRLLKSSSHQNTPIEVIAEEVGYSSKSAFYNAFKKITGKTPAQQRSSL
ncbi:helix-turn-helix domain-containing protein [uncultured Pontibacter sp.]|uniref:helix-turn-helix domain-containing protein n=1 Tax=uncultured Pontibacter sp. TaxID=453356 RepID=UPI002611BFDF|nr:helix-turn-helix domain-containing protein [uncultured Pontibacter sp.]